MSYTNKICSGLVHVLLILVASVQLAVDVRGEQAKTTGRQVPVKSSPVTDARGRLIFPAAHTSVHPPVQTLTTGPKFHWFSYYDVLQFDPTQRYVLGMESDFENRSPRPDDVIKVGMIDLQDNNRWIELGESRAWCWQQGCRLQWRFRSKTEVIWNDRQQERFVCHILDVRTHKRRTLPYPVYHVAPDGKWALGTDFARLSHMARGYGYNGVPDPDKDRLAPEGSTIYRLNLDTSEHHVLISLADIVKIPYPKADPKKDKSYFNHI
ncbi:MAG: hypothetical protein JSV03_11335, partial [Planctomycetota bacterium]